MKQISQFEQKASDSSGRRLDISKEIHWIYGGGDSGLKVASPAMALGMRSSSAESRLPSVTQRRHDFQAQTQTRKPA
jgi:hypothetical protein